ncbi:MAG: hypothetical protein WD018_08615 [Nitrosopumilaceae archaeon]
MTEEVQGLSGEDVAKDEFDHANGRPTIQEQITIERELRPYFERGDSAYFTKQKTGYDIKTVHRIFKKWSQEIFDSENTDFLKRVKEQKERTLIFLENQIDSLNESQKEINVIIGAAKKAGDFNLVEKFYKLKLKIIEHLGKFVSEKLNLVNAATSDVLVELNKMEEKKDGN